MGPFFEGKRALEVPAAQYNHDTFDDQVIDTPGGSLPPVTHRYHHGLPAPSWGTRP